MKSHILKLLKKLSDPKNFLLYLSSKEGAEESFWKQEIQKYQLWLEGTIPILYNTHSPSPKNIVKGANLKDTSILTWHKLHQEAKYLDDLQLNPDIFKGKKVLDIGSGPIPSATCFTDADIFCLEPLLHRYLQVGFPLHYYNNVKYIHSGSECIPVADNTFDAIISVNAIDHVNDIQITSDEIKRVLKPDGLFRMHVHYHPKTRAEPISFSDEYFKATFDWCKNLYKVSESRENFSASLQGFERYVLWSNF